MVGQIPAGNQEFHVERETIFPSLYYTQQMIEYIFVDKICRSLRYESSDKSERYDAVPYYLRNLRDGEGRMGTVNGRIVLRDTTDCSPGSHKAECDLCERKGREYVGGQTHGGRR